MKGGIKHYQRMDLLERVVLSVESEKIVPILLVDEIFDWDIGISPFLKNHPHVVAFL